MRRTMRLMALIVLFGTMPLFGQMKIGMDVYSRYIWRGNDFGNAQSYQPAISYASGDFSLGVWGSYSSTGSYSENDLWASYAIPTSSGTFTLYYTDYYFPSAGIKYLNFKSEGSGAHTLELGAGYTGTESLPVSVALYYNFHNDVDKSAYVQASFPISIDSVYSLTIFAGGSLGKSAWYSSANAALINVGVTVSKTVSITESFSLPMSASLIINPEIEQSNLIFGISL